LGGGCRRRLAASRRHDRHDPPCRALNAQHPAPPRPGNEPGALPTATAGGTHTCRPPGWR
jgi:hypothetical protein